MLRLSIALLFLAGCTASGPPAQGERDLTVRVVGAETDDPSQLLLAVRWVTAAGVETLPADLDDEAGVVALDGDQPLDDNAVYFDPDSGELMIDLDARPLGERVLRVQARDGDRASPFLDIAIQDRRTVPAPGD